MDEVDAVNNNTKKSVSARYQSDFHTNTSQKKLYIHPSRRFSGLLTAMKKSVNGKKSEKYAETESEVKVPVRIQR